MTLNEVLIESAVYSLLGTIVVAISLGYILFRQDRARKKGNR